MSLLAREGPAMFVKLLLLPPTPDPDTVGWGLGRDGRGQEEVG